MSRLAGIWIGCAMLACQGEPAEDSNAPSFEGEPPADGEFLLALQTGLAGELPLQFIVTLTDSTGPDHWQPSLVLQPLALALGSTTDPRTPLAPSLPATHLYHPNEWWGDELLIEATFQDVSIAAAANPNDGAQLQLSTADLFVYFHGPDALCGTLEGYTASGWFPDVGGTFAAIRIDDRDPAALPQDIPSSCAELGNP